MSPISKYRLPRILLPKVFLLLCLGFVCRSGPVWATTVTPPSFDELINEADVVFDGTVTAVSASWVGKGEAKHIESTVVFQVIECMKGQATTPFTLKTAGGAVGNVRMEIADAPKFAVGERMILFVEKNGTQIIPLVGIMHGQLRIKRDSTSNRDLILTHDNKPLFDSKEIGRDEDHEAAMSAPASPLAPMTPDNFKAEIRRKLKNIPTK